ncbi:MAG: hypothetical protein KGL39_41190 [Patescibacteria group bacterium]|nr:hypothetical protein [Patescibacteria group bacterium]
MVETFWKQESEVRDELLKRKFAAIYPTTVAKRRERNSIVKVELALFGPFVFTAFDPAAEDWKAIPSLKGVRRVLCEKTGEPIPIRNHEAATLLERCARGPVEEHVLGEFIKAGEQGVITDGTFMGMRGRCDWVRRNSARLLVKMLGGECPIEVPIQWVYPEAAAG